MPNIRIEIEADMGRSAVFARDIPYRPVGSTFTTDDDISRQLMEMYNEAQDWLRSSTPKRPIKDNPQG